jgi:hypothetical protein
MKKLKKENSTLQKEKVQINQKHQPKIVNAVNKKTVVQKKQKIDTIK